MEDHKLIKLNSLIGGAYECFSFAEFLKLAIMRLHELVRYDSGLFFCAISRDCSFFKPYAGGTAQPHYEKEPMQDRAAYLRQKEEETGGEALVFKGDDFRQGAVTVQNEPRSGFLASQEELHVACIRIVYKEQFLGEIYLHRSRDKPDFDDEDLFTLRLLQPHISIVFHIIHTVTAVNYLETDGSRMSKKGLCLLDEELSLTGGNVTGYEMLKTATVFGSSVLYHVKELCQDALSEVSAGQRARQRTGSFRTGGGNLSATVILSRNGANRVQFVVILEFEDGEQALADYKYKFTKREADIIDGIIQGKNNAQLAGALNLSENTIKTHIRSIYRKAGANNRTELAYILMLNQVS